MKICRASTLIIRLPEPSRWGTGNIICWRALTTRSLTLTSIIVTPRPHRVSICAIRITRRSITMRWGLKPRRKTVSAISRMAITFRIRLRLAGLTCWPACALTTTVPSPPTICKTVTKPGYRRIASPNDWGRFMPSTMVSRRLSAIRKVSHRYRRRVR